MEKLTNLTKFNLIVNFIVFLIVVGFIVQYKKEQANKEEYIRNVVSEVLLEQNIIKY